MRKFLILLGILLISCSNVFAAKIPVEVKDYILEKHYISAALSVFIF